MRGWGSVWLAVGLYVLAAGPVRAGVYNPGESDEAATYPDFIDNPAGKNFRDVLIILQTIPVNRPQIDNPVRRRYVFFDELITRYAGTNLKTNEDRLQGSAVLIRRRKFKEAQQLLRPIATAVDERDNFPIQSNFATALHRVGDLQGAIDMLRPLVRDQWKKSWGELPEARQRFLERVGWNEPLYDLYRDYDTAYLKLLRLRLRERITKKEGKGLLQPPDLLIDDGKDPATPIPFGKADVEFTAGKGPAMKLPPRALATVQQLLVWMPDDLRLFWLLGELYNAQGGRRGILAARQIFIELNKIEPVSDDVKKMIHKRLGVLEGAKETFDRQDTENIEIGVKKNSGEVSTSIDWRTVAVGFGVGFVLALFVVWQVRELQRRRQARSSGRNVHPI